jgi:dTDP-4-dehydrorhamnose 3,5-epimerase-like enzyme
MNLLERIHVVERKFVRDARGALLKALRGDEAGLRREIGEIYVVWADAGQMRGGHYHPLTDEYFTVLEGCCRLLLADPVTGDRAELLLDAAVPHTIHVPKGIAHAFVGAVANSRFQLLAYADRPYAPEDTIAYRFE